MKCFNCDEDGHIASQCGQVTGLRDHDPLGIHRRPAWEISADPHGWADKIRAKMGWPPPAERTEDPYEGTYALAARQVAESRASRTVLLP